jgi:hypothetical protein
MDNFLRCVFEVVIDVTGKLIAVRCQVFLSTFSSKLGSYSLKKELNSSTIFKYFFTTSTFMIDMLAIAYRAPCCMFLLWTYAPQYVSSKF